MIIFRCSCGSHNLLPAETYMNFVCQDCGKVSDLYQVELAVKIGVTEQPIPLPRNQGLFRAPTLHLATH